MRNSLGRSRPRGPGSWISATLALLLFDDRPSVAKPTGIDDLHCYECHDDNLVATATLTADKMAPAMGETVRLTATVEYAGAKIGGLRIETNAIGTLKAGTGTQILEGGVTHTAPRAAVSNKVTFLVDWVAPNAMDSVEFMLSMIAANNDEKSHGDAFGSDFLSLAVGCNGGSKFFHDRDEDGFGEKDSVAVNACAKTATLSVKADDCDDFEAKTNPDAPEMCNLLDDNCNGETDEGLPSITIYEDKDLDGHGGRQMTKMGCGAMFGWSTTSRDCNDDDKLVNPDAEETCDQRDENCNGRVDEGARRTCGEGRCLQTASSCDENAACTPSQPRPEACNFLDDDCDGETDEDDDICDAGEICESGMCVSGSGGDNGGGNNGGGGNGGGSGEDDDGKVRKIGGGCAFAGSGSAGPEDPAQNHGDALGTAALLIAVMLRARSRRRRYDRPGPPGSCPGD